MLFKAIAPEMNQKKIILSLFSLYLLSLSIKGLVINIFEIQVNIYLSLLFTASFLTILSNNEKKITPLFVSILVFFVASCCSILFSVIPERSIEHLYMLVPWIVVHIVISGTVKTTSDAVYIVNILILLSLIISIKLLYTCLIFNELPPTDWVKPTEWVNRSNIPIVLVPNDLIIITSIIPFSLHKFFFSKSMKNKVFMGLLLIIYFVVIILYESRGALISGIFSIAIYLLLSKKLNLLAYLIIPFLLLVIVDGFNEFRLLNKSIHSYQVRFGLLWISWHMFLDAPFFGQGISSFASFYTEDFVHKINISRFISIKELNSLLVTWPHNLYIELLAERGLIGLTSFFYMNMTVLKQINKQIIESNAMLTTILASLMSIYFSAIIELSFTRFWVGLMIILELSVIYALAHETKK